MTAVWRPAVEAREASIAGAGTAAAGLAFALQAVTATSDARRIHMKRVECLCISRFPFLSTMQVFWQIGVPGAEKVSESMPVDVGGCGPINLSRRMGRSARPLA